jgi:hypothetical protein
MAESDPNPEPTLVERWLQDQQQWQRTLFAYLDSMMKNDEFLVHMGNAMRGSLLAGKPYPSASAPSASATGEEAATADRLDKVLFALTQLQGQMADVLMTLEELRGIRPSPIAAPAKKSTRSKRTAAPAARTAKRRRARS